MSPNYFSKLISLRSKEEIVVVIHHHPVTYIKQILVTVFLILLAFFLMFFLFSLGPIGVALFLALILTAVFYGLREFYIWFMNVFIITNKRIIDIDQKGFFNRTVSEADYEKIMDLSYSVKGFFQTVLKLGTIKIQAAGIKLAVKNVKNVVKINQVIADLVKEETGQVLKAKKSSQLNSQEKEQITKDFLDQDELEKYDDYELKDLLDYYNETFGEIRLKKMLVDELEKYEEEGGVEDKKEQEVEDEQEDLEEETGNEEEKDLEEEEVPKTKKSNNEESKKLSSFKKRNLN